MAGSLGPSARGFGVPFLVSAGIVFEIIAFACSSPQTAEINIATRGDTLMKWVHLGEGLGLVMVAIAAKIDPPNRGAIIAGGVFALASSELFYRHAKASGLSNPGPGTEQSYQGG